MKSFVLTFLALVFAAGAVSASEMREIELTDGSVITGEVVSLTRGIYTVRSAALGTVKVEESKVRTIRMRGSKGGSGDTEGRVQSLQEKMMSNGEIMNMVQSLEEDPEVQKIMQDPEIMKAVQAGDINALIANPRFMKLLNNKVVQGIKNKIPE